MGAQDFSSGSNIPLTKHPFHSNGAPHEEGRRHEGHEGEEGRHEGHEEGHEGKEGERHRQGQKCQVCCLQGRQGEDCYWMTKDKLIKNKNGRIVSKAQSTRAKRNWANSGLKKWADAVKAARKALNLTGFVAIGGKSATGKALYAKAKALLK